MAMDTKSFLKEEIKEARKAVRDLDAVVSRASSFREKCSRLLEEANRALSRLERVSFWGAGGAGGGGFVFGRSRAWVGGGRSAGWSVFREGGRCAQQTGACALCGVVGVARPTSPGSHLQGGGRCKLLGGAACQAPVL
eukprot:354045-Chlamydomonas_euryale.AAC.1